MHRHFRSGACQRGLWNTAWLTVVLLGCGLPAETEPSRTRPVDSLEGGARAAGSSPQVIDLGPADVFEQGEPQAFRASERTSAAADRLAERLGALPPTAADEVRLLRFDVRRGTVASVTFAQPALAELYAELRRRGRFGAEAGGLPDGSPANPLETAPLRAGPRESPTELVEKGWSGGSDSRRRYAIEDGYAADHPVYQSMGQYEYGGSGTLFSKRIALTAAHVLVTSSGTVYSSNRFAPRRSLTQHPANPDHAPFGQASLWYLWLDQSWYADRCYDTNSDDQPSTCGARDWMFTIFSPDPWVGDPEPMAATYVRLQDLSNRTYNRGYPICSGPDKPAGCESSWQALYGQPGTCAIGRGGSPEPGTESEYRLIEHGCDTSNGMSGGPMYVFGWGLPFLVGIHTSFPDHNTSTPNLFRPITNVLLWTMAYFADACDASASCS